MKRIAIVGAAALIALSGCATDPFTGERRASRTAQGGAIGAAGGAAAGAVLGEVIGDKAGKGAAIGAAAGALLGGGIGVYMDRQEAQLREQLEGTGVSVTRAGDQIILNMPGNITFATASSDINSSFYPVLNSVAVVLKEYDQTQVNVAGHTDSRGSDSYNLDLSKKRASQVADYLVSQPQVNPARFNVIGFGEARPIASNASEAGMAANRRVEITLSPPPQG